ncbi:YifB family Mg chelatase-like AAA ATPase [Polycladidibacter hongkongensis]|uniref:YifB family Mg chelatase-like AAA ATPase n=1 Tax=Polycladidibacter hongkongensis TaxID=1647556 RepID=UPI000833347F|nr:YifB family Mg chelatase-like AAA ATPase [Pseudovibrio hongkongensis]
MFSRVCGVAFQGVEAVDVDVQVQIGPGAVQFSIVGLPDKAVAESRERVRAALLATGLALPAKRVTVNLAPADLPKEGSHFDLAIALGLLCAMEIIPPDALDSFAILGELSLNGEIVGVSGVLPAAIHANAQGLGLICPRDCGGEAAWADEGMQILAPANLIELCNHFKGVATMQRPQAKLGSAGPTLPDLADVRGQGRAKRALEIAAAGGHNLLFVGPPGAGKSLLAARLPSLLPPLSASELLEVSMIASVAGELEGGKLTDRRPFRAPHHSASMAALVGGGIKARPGEISLAHNGVLFLDELPEFHPQALDSLRQPMETGSAMIVRANNRVSYPARFQLVAAMNPCRCGMAGQPGHTCRRGERCAADYQARVSGPFLDRIDIQLEVPAVRAVEMMGGTASEPSAQVALRVAKAREIQQERYRGDVESCRTNSHCSAKNIEKHTVLERSSRDLFYRAAEQMQLSARGFHRVLKVSRSIADLEGSAQIKPDHLAEALSFRQPTTSERAA